MSESDRRERGEREASAVSVTQCDSLGCHRVGRSVGRSVGRRRLIESFVSDPSSSSSSSSSVPDPSSSSPIRPHPSSSVLILLLLLLIILTCLLSHCAPCFRPKQHHKTTCVFHDPDSTTGQTALPASGGEERRGGRARVEDTVGVMVCHVASRRVMTAASERGGRARVEDTVCVMVCHGASWRAS